MIKVGNGAERDPLLAYASVMASELLKKITARPPARRLAWIRSEMNKTNPGGGDAVVRKFHELSRQGSGANQALFDALRLTIANQIASVIDRGRGTSGLGTSENDINAVFCGIMGSATVGGSIYGAASSNPSGSAAVGQAGSSAMLSAGCNAGALREQRMTAEANARIAEAAAAAGGGMQVTASGDNTVLYVVGGGVALVAVLGAVLLLRKK